MSDIDHIPIDWQKLPLKRVADITNSGCYGDDDESDERTEPLKAITTAHIDPLSGFKTENASVRYFSRREKSKYVGRPGDIFVVKSSGSNENVITGKRAQIRDEDDLVFTNFLLRVRANQRSNPRFLYHLLGSSLVHSRIKREVATTTYPNLNLRQYLGEPLPIPDLAIQRQIADFLDHETARIDLLIEKKQRLVALLGEKVTAFREANIANGELTRMKFIANYITSGSRDWGSLYSDDGELFVRIGNVSGSGIDLDLRKKTYVNLEGRTEGIRTRLRVGDLLVSITADLGSVAVVNQEAEGAYINQHLALVRLRRSQVNPRYVAHAMITRAASDQFSLRGYGGTKQGLSLKDVAEIAIPLPAKGEQERIAKQIDQFTSLQREASEKINASIDRLKEYRSALITAAVTGQIDVSTYARSGTTDRHLDAIQEETGS